MHTSFLFRLGKLTMVAAIISIALSASTYAADCYWINNLDQGTPGDAIEIWTNPNNWASSSGGNAGTCADADNWPDSDDHAIFDGSGTNGDSDVTIPGYNLGTLELASGYTQTVSATSDIILYGTDSLLLDAGEFESTSGTLYVYGNFEKTSGTFTPNGGTVEFMYSTPSNLYAGSGNSLSFNNVTINKTSTYVEIGANDVIAVNGTLTMENGELTDTGSGYFASDGPVSWLDTFDGGNGWVRFTNSTGRTVSIPDQAVLCGFRVEDSNMTVNAQGDFTAEDGFMITNDATFNNTATSILQFDDIFTLSGSSAVFNAGTGTTVTHDGTVTILAGTYDGQTASEIEINAFLDIDGGTFDAELVDLLDLNGVRATTYESMVVDSGTFQAPGTGNTTTIAGGIDLSGGGTYTDNSGTLTFDGNETGNPTFDLNGSLTISSLRINSGSSTYDELNLGDGDDLTLTGSFTMQSGQFNGGTGGSVAMNLMSHTGGTYNQETSSISTTSTYSQSGGTFNGGAADINVGTDMRIYGGSFTAGVSDYIIGTDLEINQAGSGIDDDAVVDFSDTTTVDIGQDILIGDGNYGSAGSFTMSTGTTTIYDDYLFNSSNASNTVLYSPTGTVIFDGIDHTLSNSGSTFEFQHLKFVTGNFYIERPVTSTASLDWQTGRCYGDDVLKIEGTYSFSSTYADGDTCYLEFDSSAQTFVLPASATTNYYPDIIISGSSDVELSGTGTVNFDNITVNGGTFDVSGTSINIVSGLFRQDAGTYNGAGSTGTKTYSSMNVNRGSFLAGPSDYIINGSVYWNNDAWNSVDDATIDFGNAASVIIYGNLNSGDGNYGSAGSVKFPANRLTLSGNLNIPSGSGNTTTYDYNDGIIRYIGSANSVIGYGVYDLATLEIFKDDVSDVVQQNRPITFTGDIVIIRGTLDVDFENNVVQGNFVMCPSAEYGDTDCESMDASDSRFINDGRTITLSGSCDNPASPTPATCQGIYGYNGASFGNLTKTVTSDDTLYFEDGVANETRINGTLTLQGSASGDLSLRSMSDGDQFYINPQGSVNVSYLDIQDANNSRGSDIVLVGTNSNDSGNNSGWDWGPIVANLNMSSDSGNFEYPDDLTISYNITDGTHGRTNWKKDDVSVTSVYLPMDGSNGNELTTTPDISGNGRNGTVTSASWSTSGGHDSRGAYSFTGTEYITVPSVHLDTFTISFYTKISSKSGQQSLISKSEGSEWSFNIDHGSAPDAISFWLHNNGSWYNANFSDSLITLDTWHHIVGTYDGETMNLYLDGSLEGSNTDPSGNITSNSAPICIAEEAASSSCSQGFNFTGSVDELIILPYAMDSTAISSLNTNGLEELNSQKVFPTNNWKACVTGYNGPNGTYSSESCTAEQTITWDGVESQQLTSTSGYFVDEDDITADYSINNGTHGMVAWYKNSSPWNIFSYPMDGENGDESTECTDISGNNRDATSLNNVSWKSKGGHDNYGAYEFVGGEDSYISIPTSGLPYGSSERTMCLWAETDTISSEYAWAGSYGNDSNGEAFFIGRNGTTLYGGAWNADLSESNYWTTDTWNHICLVYDGSKMYLYSNGSLLKSEDKTINTVENTAYIGRQVHDFDSWDGTIDNFQLFAEALSEEQIASLYSNDLDTIVSEELTVGDNWKAEIYAFDNSTSGAQSPGEETGDEDILDDPPAAVAIPEFSTWLLLLTMLGGVALIIRKNPQIIPVIK